MATMTDPLDPIVVAKDFPLLNRRDRERPLVYLDSAASSQHPSAVLDAMDRYYETTHANVHRGVYALAEEATTQFEAARTNVGRFVNAPRPATEIIFTKNATEAINLVAQSWGRRFMKAGDAILLTIMEHHANLVPWQMLAAEKGLELRYLDVDDSGYLDLSNLDRLMNGTKLVGITLTSNVLGTIVDQDRGLPAIIEAARSAGAVVLADGSQYVPHSPTDVRALGCDFLAFTGHKMLGPTGIGVLWGREDRLDAMPPFLGGGEMISDVRLDGFTPTELPWKFEAGTPPIAEAIGLSAAVDYLRGIGMERVRAHERELCAYAIRTLGARYGGDLRIFGPTDPDARSGVLSLALDDVHPHDVAQVLDEAGVCVRAGHHCAKPLMRRLGVAATARASVYVYNTEADIDALADALEAAASLFARH